jgi:hypothetical protein
MTIDDEGLLSRRGFIVAMTATVAAAVTIIIFAILMVSQHTRYMAEFTRRQTSCVTGGGTWSQNVGGDWECRR